MSSLDLVSGLAALAVGTVGNVRTTQFFRMRDMVSLCFSVVCRGCLLCGRNGKLANPHH